MHTCDVRIPCRLKKILPFKVCKNITAHGTLTIDVNFHIKY